MLTTLLILVFGFGFFIYLIINDSIKKYNAKKKREAERKKREEEKEHQEQIEQARLVRELDAIANSIITDWNATHYPDKVETPGNGIVTFEFENGDTIFFKGNTLIYNTSSSKLTYTIGLSYQNKFRNIFNRIVGIINSGKTAKRYSSYSSYSSRSNSSSNSSYKDGGKKSTSNNPKQRRYDIIIGTIKLRKENLAKMSKNDPSRAALENELKAAERKAMEIKKEIV